MQVIDNDPLDRHINIDRATIEKNPYYDRITVEEKVSIALDALFDDSKMSKSDFNNLVNETLIKL